MLKTGGKLNAAGQESALEFKSGDAPWVFYQAKDNLAYTGEDWSGRVSFWLKCDPVDGLADGYCDPVQFTPRAWNDAAFFLDLNKEGKPRDFRLGCFADEQVWNPEGGDVPESKRPLLTAVDPKFGAGKWTHVLFTWQGFNTRRKNAVGELYLDGELNGTLTGWDQRFTWNPGKSARLLLGLLDEFACFNRVLTAAEVKRIHGMKDGIRALLESPGRLRGSAEEWRSDGLPISGSPIRHHPRRGLPR